MEKGDTHRFSSPINQKITPLKRLGLARKRKSSGMEKCLNAKIQACSESFPVSCDLSEKRHAKKDTETVEKDCDNEVTESNINYDEEIETLKKKITEREEKLKALQNVKGNIVQLEELIELWRNGCKKALLYFLELLKERQSKVDLKAVLYKLGIWEVFNENFENDQDIPFADYSQ